MEKQQVNCCLLPKKVSKKQADVYAKIRDTLIRAHCENDAKDHPCAGCITITAKHVTLSCRLCGDARLLTA
jgi:hypothetical protein